VISRGGPPDARSKLTDNAADQQRKALRAPDRPNQSSARSALFEPRAVLRLRCGHGRGQLARNRAIVYEIDENIEAAEIGPGVPISRTIAPFLEDFSALATFVLRAIVSSDADLVSRLT